MAGIKLSTPIPALSKEPFCDLGQAFLSLNLDFFNYNMGTRLASLPSSWSCTGHRRGECCVNRRGVTKDPQSWRGQWQWLVSSNRKIISGHCVVDTRCSPSGRSPPRDKWQFLVWRREHGLGPLFLTEMQECKMLPEVGGKLVAFPEPRRLPAGLFLGAWHPDSPECCLCGLRTFYVWSQHTRFAPKAACIRVLPCWRTFDSSHFLPQQIQILGLLHDLGLVTHPL